MLAFLPISMLQLLILCQSSVCFSHVQIVTEVKGVAASTVYDCLHDPEFRPVWDSNLVEAREICVIDAQNDIGYYQGILLA